MMVKNSAILLYGLTNLAYSVYDKNQKLKAIYNKPKLTNK